MDGEHSRMWMLRAGRGGWYVDKFRKTNTVGIGWNEIGDLSSVQQDGIRALVEKVWQDRTNYQIGADIGIIVRFRFAISIGDHVVSYDPSERKYLVGTIISDYEFSHDEESPYRHTRKVSWKAEVPRDQLSVDTRNTLGGLQTVYSIGDDPKSELLKEVSTEGDQPAIVEPAAHQFEELGQDAVEKATEFIKDQINAIEPKQMEHLVAGLLRGMGYKTRVTPFTKDRGRDVMASPDEFGFANPRIIAEVKHRKGKMGAPAVRQLLGVLKSGDCGLYVSTGGFSRDAYQVIENSNVPLKLVDVESLVSLIVQYYDEFDAEARAILPLRKIYWPGVSV